MWLVCVGLDTDVPMKKELPKYLGVKSGNLRGGDADALYRHLGCKKGMVNFFSIVNDPERKVKLLYDKALYEAPWQSFHPMDNAASTCINVEGVKKIKELCGRDDTNFEIVDFTAMVD